MITLSAGINLRFDLEPKNNLETAHSMGGNWCHNNNNWQPNAR